MRDVYPVRLHAVVGAMVLSTLAGCASGPPSTVPASVPHAGHPAHADGVTDQQVRALVEEMADEYGASLAEAIYVAVRGEEPTPTARTLAQSFLRNGMGAAIDIAINPNPDAALLDLLVLARLQAWAFREHWIPAGIGEAGLEAADKLDRASAATRESARQVLSDEQIATVDLLIDAWIRTHPDRMVVSLVRFEEFTDERLLPAESLRREASGLLRQVSEASIAVEQAVDLGARAMWYAGRYPYVLGQQAELTTYRLLEQPELREALLAIEDLRATSRALEERLRSLDSDMTAQQTELFARVALERERAIEQAQAAANETLAANIREIEELAERVRIRAVDYAFEKIAGERTEFLDDLESRQAELQGLMVELRETIQASGGLAHELTGTVNAIDSVVSRFDRDPDSTAEPLRLEDVRDAAAELRLAAAEVTELLQATNELAESEAIEQRFADIDHATNRAIDRAFNRALLVVAALIVGLGLIRLIPQRRSG